MAQVKYTSVRWCEACGMMVNAERVTVGERTYSVCARCGAREEERWGWGAQTMKAINLKNAMEAKEALDKARDRVRYYKEHRYSADKLQEAMVASALACEAYTKEIEAIDAVVDEVQGKARERLINGRRIIEVLVEYQHDLDITQKALDGTSVDFNLYRQEVPNAYKYPMQTTMFTAEYRRGSWRLVNVERTQITSWRIRARLSDAAKEAILHKYALS